MILFDLNADSTDGYEQVFQIYEQIFGIQSISKLNFDYISSGQLLNDLHVRLSNSDDKENNNSNKTNEAKLEELMHITEYKQKQKNDIWDILLPEYHKNNKRKSLPLFDRVRSPSLCSVGGSSSSAFIEWHRLLQVFRIIKMYFSKGNQSLASTPTPPRKNILTMDSSSNESESLNGNQMTASNLRTMSFLGPRPVMDNGNNYFQLNPQQKQLQSPPNKQTFNLTSFTPPTSSSTRKCNNLITQNAFLTQQQFRPYRQIQFAGQNKNKNPSSLQRKFDDTKQKEETCTPSISPTKSESVKASPPAHQIIMSAKKVMSVHRRNNLDLAMLASGRKMYKPNAPKSDCKTKKCTPGNDGLQRVKMRDSDLKKETPLANTRQDKVLKKLDFIHEEEDEEDKNKDTMTSHYGWKARSRESSQEPSGNKEKSLNISMLSHVLVDLQSSNETSEQLPVAVEQKKNAEEDAKFEMMTMKMDELEMELTQKNISIEEYEKNLNEKNEKLRILQQDFDGMESNFNLVKEQNTKYTDKCMQMEEKCELFEAMKEEIAKLKQTNDSMEQLLAHKNSEYEEKCHSFIEELSKKDAEIKQKDAENIQIGNEMNTLKAKLIYFKNRALKMDKLQRCKSRLMDITTDYRKLKNQVTFDLKRGLQDFIQCESALKQSIEEGPTNLTQFNFAENSMETPQFLKNKSNLIEIKQERDELKSNLLQLNVSYQKEKKLRKKLLEQVIDLKGNIRVFCRVRPRINRAASTGDEPELMATTCLDDERIAINDHATNNEKEFTFDQVYAPNSAQEAIFEDVKPLIQSAVDGYNCCIFAYGQTGSGKTYTMEGSNENPGVIYRTFDELFDLKEEHMNNEKSNDEQEDEQDDDSMRIYLSCLEIYNEKIKDLLQSKHTNHNLKAKLSKCGKKVLVPGLTRNEVFDTNNVKHILQKVAYKNRSTGSTDMNEHSSRSHALLFLDIVTRTTSSRLVLIDLAGSERVKWFYQMFVGKIIINEGRHLLIEELLIITDGRPQYDAFANNFQINPFGLNMVKQIRFGRNNQSLGRRNIICFHVHESKCQYSAGCSHICIDPLSIAYPAIPIQLIIIIVVIIINIRKIAKIWHKIMNGGAQMILARN